MPPLIARRPLAGVATLALHLTAACRSPSDPDGFASRLRASERVLLLEVAPSRVPCTGPFPRECLQVRSAPDAPWEYFYDEIEGFAYEPGHRYRLRIARRAVPNPPQDASSYAYRLLAVLEKVPGWGAARSR